MIKDATVNRLPDGADDSYTGVARSRNSRGHRSLPAVLTYVLTADPLLKVIVGLRHAKNSAPGLLKQTSFIIHDWGWQSGERFAHLPEMPTSHPGWLP